MSRVALLWRCTKKKLGHWAAPCVPRKSSHFDGRMSEQLKQLAAANKALPLALNASGCDSQRELAWKRLNADSAVDDWTINLYRIQLDKKFLSPENAQDQEWSLMDSRYIYIYIYMCVYIYVYIYMCVSIIYIYMSIKSILYIYMCVCRLYIYMSIVYI